MTDRKDHYIAIHEELVAAYLDRHPNSDWSEAYDKCADLAYDTLREREIDAADMARMRAKDRIG